MKNKTLIISISVVAVIGLAFTSFLFNFGGETTQEAKNETPEVRGVSNIKNTISQQELWDTAMTNFQSTSDNYSSLGTIKSSVSRFGMSFDFTIQFEVFVDQENTDMRIFSGDEETFIKLYNSEVYLSENSSQESWYELDLSGTSNTSGQSLDLDNLTNIANLGNNFGNITPNYLNSLECSKDICQSYQVQINDRSAEIIISQSSQSIQEVRLNNDGRDVSISFADSDRSVSEPKNITPLDPSESRTKAQEAISGVVRSSIF